jgi:hypothetical protein
VKYAPQDSTSREAGEARLHRYGLRVASRLSEQTAALAPDLSERLRFAREQALERARAARKLSAQAASAPALGVQINANGTLSLGGGLEGSSGWWGLLGRFGNWLPMLLLVAGLLGIQELHQRFIVNAAADVDAELLADDLPPAAYGDPGFGEFLKVPPAAAAD